jgi:peptidoglycan/LPS O-acetylase OafA/YrhL
MGVIITHVAFSTGVVLGSDAGPPKQGIWSILAVGLEVSLGPFFILSGMLLYRPFARRTILGKQVPPLRHFFLRRLLRLVPAYWVLAAFCLLLLNFSSIHSAWYVLRPLLFMQDYDYVWYAGMDPTWTVPTELQFYIVLPLLAVLMHRLAKGVADPVQKIRRMSVPLVGLVVVGFAFTAYMHKASLGPWPTVYWWPFSRVGLFGIGMWMALQSVLAEARPQKLPGIYRLAASRPNLYWLVALAALAVDCISPFGHRGTWDYGSPLFAVVQQVAFTTFAAALCIPLVAPKGRSRFIEAVLSNRPMRYLGRISYGLYLWHFAVMYLWFQSGSIFGAPPKLAFFLIGTVGFWEMVTVVIIGSIVFSSVSYYLIERPLLLWGERIVARSKARKAATVTALPQSPTTAEPERKSA